jgi:hypothetical protein
MADGELIFFSNQGVDGEGSFAGLNRIGTIIGEGDGCTVRDLKIASLAPCTQSVVTAQTCGGFLSSNNFLFTTTAPCQPTPAPTPLTEESNGLKQTVRPAIERTRSPIVVLPTVRPTSSPALN